MDAPLSNRSLDGDLAEARSRYEANRPRSRAAHDAACEVMPGGNTRTVLHYGPFPMRIAKGQGAVITDLDGRSYLNMLGEYTAGVFGHSHPVIRRAVDRALDGGVNLGAHNTFEAELARLVVARFPAIEKVRFTNSGTEANLMALATARHITGRRKILVFRGGYHGGLLHFAGGGIPINAPYEFVLAPYNDIEGTRAVLRAAADELACVLVEAMMGSAGCIPADPAFLAMLRSETAAAGALLILDEVMTSRFGTAGAQGLLGLRPDLVTLGKWMRSVGFRWRWSGAGPRRSPAARSACRSWAVCSPSVPTASCTTARSARCRPGPPTSGCFGTWRTSGSGSSTPRAQRRSMIRACWA
ncbi:aminotransferase class III-fold pyridoxal phosphate-dependent enzyme [Leptolyngbya sp. 15MV]|nr:aminotransferase class III-fold pyridoxal phosphate-dependent enzyme [Leptolyngbya sp. 15MV]